MYINQGDLEQKTFKEGAPAEQEKVTVKLKPEHYTRCSFKNHTSSRKSVRIKKLLSCNHSYGDISW